MTETQMIAWIKRALAQTAGVVSKLSVRVDALERTQRRAAQTAQKFWIFRAADVTGVRYDPPQDRPPHGSGLVFDRDVDNAIGGAYRPGGGAAIFRTFTYEGTATSVHTEDLVDTDTWDPATPYLVYVVAQAGSAPDGFPRVPIPASTWSSPGQPITVEDATLTLTGELAVDIDSSAATLSLDGDDVAVTFPELTIAMTDAWSEIWGPWYPTPYINGIVTDGTAPVQITHPLTENSAALITGGIPFPDGTPSLQILVSDVNTDAYPNPISMQVRTCVVPLPAALEVP